MCTNGIQRMLQDYNIIIIYLCIVLEMEKLYYYK